MKNIFILLDMQYRLRNKTTMSRVSEDQCGDNLKEHGEHVYVS